MKNPINNLKNLLVKIGALCLISMALSSCLKSNDSNYSPPVALVTFIQASPDAPAMDLYLNNNKVNNNPVNFGDNINYFNAYAGSRIVNLYAPGTTNKIFADTVVLNPNYAYSMFLANKASNLQILLLTDTIGQPTTGMASVRFVNLSPDAPAVDLAVHGGAVISSNKAFKGFSSFSPITGGSTYTFDIRQAGTNTVLTSISNIKLITGSVYTIWFRGLATPTNSTNGLSAGILTNASY